MTSSNDAPDRPAAEAALLELVADGAAERRPLGDDAAVAAAAATRGRAASRLSPGRGAAAVQAVDPGRRAELRLAVERRSRDVLGQAGEALLHLGAGEVGARRSSGCRRRTSARGRAAALGGDVERVGPTPSRLACQAEISTIESGGERDAAMLDLGGRDPGGERA